MYNACKKSPDLDPHHALPQINLKKIQKNL